MIIDLKPIEKYGLTTDRVKHIKAVTRGVLNHRLFPTLTRQEQIVLLLASQYHDVGYSEELTHNVGKSQKHYIHGYLHLKARGVANQVCRLVLHHTYARDLERIKFNDLTIFNKNPLLPQDAKLLFILNDSDMTTNGHGETVTKDIRLKDIVNRYGEAHFVTLHFKKALQLHVMEEQKYITEETVQSNINDNTDILKDIMRDIASSKRGYLYHQSSKTIEPYVQYEQAVSLPTDTYSLFSAIELTCLLAIGFDLLYPNHLMLRKAQ